MKNILYILHNGKAGGVYLNVLDIIKNLDDSFKVFLLFSEQNQLELYEFTNNKLNLINTYEKKKWDILEYHNMWLSYVYFDILLKNKINLVHIHHFINHSFDLPIIAKKLGCKVLISLHDYYLMCPFYTLIDENMKYCGGKCSKDIKNCFKPVIIDNINSKYVIESWRENISSMFKYVDYFISPSYFTKDLFLSTYEELNDENTLVIEHGGDYPKITKNSCESDEKDGVIKILCPANHLDILKGSEFIKELTRIDTENKLDFYFMGNVSKELEKYGTSYGVYKREDFQSIVKEINPKFIGIFSICPETFCYTLSESWSCGIPILGTNIGVINERITNNKGGWVLDYTNPKEAYQKILEISTNHNEYKQIQDNVKNINLKSTYDMSLRYRHLYNLLI